MKFYIGVTDNDWYNFLRKINPEDINFWQPGGQTPFKLLSRGAPFLFKLKMPNNIIAGIGFFSSHIFLPISVAWDTFGSRNGCADFKGFQAKILNYRAERNNPNPTIGCIVLTNPIFFKTEDWIEAPSNWAKSIVQGKSYSTEDSIGKEMWRKIEMILPKYLFSPQDDDGKNQFLLEEDMSPNYSKSVLTKVRIGQGAFRVLITDAYSRRCSITGEKTLPVLEAAHIKPYSDSGPHSISNGLLLRSDIHKLFDAGYMTVTKDYKIEISSRIKEEFHNGREYYQYHGKTLQNLPTRLMDQPNEAYIEWHNANIFKS